LRSTAVKGFASEARLTGLLRHFTSARYLEKQTRHLAVGLLASDRDEIATWKNGTMSSRVHLAELPWIDRQIQIASFMRRQMDARKRDQRTSGADALVFEEGVR
jgi:hypothetical protein